MNKNVLIVLGGGFLVAILVAVLVNASLNGNKPAPTAEAVYSEILVASKDLSIGTEVNSTNVKWQSWPEDAIFGGAIVRTSEEQEASDAASGRLNQNIKEGQPVLPGYLVTESKGNFMAATLAPGMRAVGVSVKAETMAGGFIGPGDYVDVILTYKVRVNTNDNPDMVRTISEVATETVLENIRVLAVDQQSDRKDDEVKVARTATLEVDIAGAEKLALASEMGDISLSLRSLGDTEMVPEGTMTTDVRASKVLNKVMEMKAEGDNASGIVRVFNGDTISNIPVRTPVKVDKE